MANLENIMSEMIKINNQGGACSFEISIRKSVVQYYSYFTPKGSSEPSQINEHDSLNKLIDQFREYTSR